MIGILGGTFDPIHNGHLQIARKVLASLPLLELQFMPCAIPVHRGQPHSSAQHRLNMIKLVVARYQGFAVNTGELERNNPSYTVDSLRELHAQRQAVYVLVMGADAFNGFSSWRQPEEILRLSHLLVCQRPGVQIDTAIFAHHWVDSVEQFSDRSAGAILRLELDECECSSSEVRRSLALGEVPDDCLPAEVIEYIKLHNLYRSISD